MQQPVAKRSRLKRTLNALPLKMQNHVTSLGLLTSRLSPLQIQLLVRYRHELLPPPMLSR